MPNLVPTGETQSLPEAPAKFRDSATGELRVDALLKSYLELERKLARMIELPGENAAPEQRQQFNRALGVPARPEDYTIKLSSPLIEPDAEVNRRLHEAGFTPAQVQLVYDLAIERMVPAVSELAADFEADRELGRLHKHFGGDRHFNEVARSIKAWGQRNLPPQVFEALSSTCDGVIAMHAMMNSKEPRIALDGESQGPLGLAELKRLMNDPRYWRDKDPAIVAQVTEGFQRLFPGRSEV